GAAHAGPYDVDDRAPAQHARELRSPPRGRPRPGARGAPGGDLAQRLSEYRSRIRRPPTDGRRLSQATGAPPRISAAPSAVVRPGGSVTPPSRVSGVVWGAEVRPDRDQESMPDARPGCAAWRRCPAIRLGR